MERPDQIKSTVRVFSTLMKLFVPCFSFPGGGAAVKSISSCLDSLEKLYSGELSRERIVDYCVCQAYTASRYGADYITKWNITHSFGNKALERFKETGKAKRYYEDKWLQEHDLSRSSLLSLIADRKQHPLFKFIYPEHEDITKMRMQSNEVGYYICAMSTLLWTPFSPVCRTCQKADLCKERTRQRYPELFRIRCQEYTKKE